MATNNVYTVFKYEQGLKNLNLSTDTLKIALFTSSYSPNQDTDVTYSSLTGEVATGGGYTAGGVALTGQVWAQDNTNHRGKLTANNPSWTIGASAISFQTVVLYDSTVATNNLICYWNFGAVQSTGTNGTFTLQFDNGTDQMVLYLA